MEKKTRVLAVDDQPFILELLKQTLEPEGFAVSVATDGESGLALMAETQPEIVLLDIRMPGLDGYQVLERIRQVSNVPVLMLTAVPDRTGLVRSFDIGANDYIRKPFVTTLLIARIKTKLRRARGEVVQDDEMDSGE
jgi:DNA-binding response OmpR family regulator